MSPNSSNVDNSTKNSFFFTAVREKNGGGDGVNVASVNSLEYVAMTITLHHVRRGALEISLTSPNRTYCTLSTPRPNDKSVKVIVSH